VDKDLNLTLTVDPEVKQRWIPLSIINGYDVMKVAEEFVGSMGRMKYLKPIYSALLATGQKTTAQKWLEDNLKFYHPYSIEVL